MEKALELIGALDHDKTFRLFFFLARRNQYTNVGKLFLFLKLIHVDSHGLLVDSHGSHVDSHDSLARWLAYSTHSVGSMGKEFNLRHNMQFYCLKCLSMHGKG